MKKILTLTALCGISIAKIAAQCVTINCPSNVSTQNDPGFCGANVSFSAPAANSSCVLNATDTFFYTGTQQTFTVPAGVNILTVETWGAQGGANWVNNVNYGGYVKGDITVTPGEVLYIYVGQQPTTITGGYNGGGNGEGAGKGGGGGTDVRQGGIALANRVVIAGGGGGAGYWSSLHVVGGVGGGLTGGDGYRDPSYAANPGGAGGTQSGGGPYGTCVSFNNPVCAGSLGQGGAPSGCGCEGYGGGGGYYGGAGSGNCRGGGGGSGYIIPSAINTNMLSGVRVGNGLCVITVSGGTTSPTVTQTAGLASGSLFPVGTTTNTFLADDGAGNTATCSFSVTIIDNEGPVITNVPANITQTSDVGQCGANVSWSGPSILDNCSATSSSNHNSGDFFPVGSTTVTYTATDGAGNNATASFTVTVTDNEAPAIICPSNVVVNNDPGQCGATNVVIGSATATDNCSVASTMSNAPGMYPIGITQITWTSTDVNGNSSTCIQTVTVNDVEAPMLSSCPANITMCPGVVQFADPAATDNCSATVTQISGPTAGSVLTAGNYTVTYVAQDPSGNTDSCSFNITVNANPNVTLNLTTPSTVCFDDANYTLGGGSPAGGTWSGNGVTGSSFDPSVAGNGSQTITYNYVDANGCMGSATGSIMVSQCAGISEHGEIYFNLYPNPAAESFWFESNGNGTLELFDASGKLVLSNQITNAKQQINLENLANGIYSVRFTSANAVANGKLTIQK